MESDGRGGGGGGGDWTSLIFKAVVGAGAAFFWWNLFHSKKKSSGEQVELRQLEDLLLERQHVCCSLLSLNSRRLTLENTILQRSAQLEPRIPGVTDDVKQIFTEDRSCGDTLMYLVTKDKTRNGALMWKLLKVWRSRLEKPSQQE